MEATGTRRAETSDERVRCVDGSETCGQCGRGCTDVAVDRVGNKVCVRCLATAWDEHRKRIAVLSAELANAKIRAQVAHSVARSLAEELSARRLAAQRLAKSLAALDADLRLEARRRGDVDGEQLVNAAGVLERAALMRCHLEPGRA